MRAHNSFFHAPEPLDLFKMEDKEKIAIASVFHLLLNLLPLLVLTFNSEFPKNIINTCLYMCTTK